MPETRRVRAFADRLVVAEDLLERVVGERNELREENARLRRLVARLVTASEELAAEAPAVLPGGGEDARAAVRAANQDAICELGSDTINELEAEWKEGEGG